ncbi:MAG: hypothetical protein CM1200mP36_03100 [Gammaproteobacteria bacterium]|nr:MAG: hypothetical protein CM1200mP36_03100 [Gammaproteobacteria bacterium]
MTTLLDDLCSEWNIVRYDEITDTASFSNLVICDVEARGEIASFESMNFWVSIEIDLQQELAEFRYVSPHETVFPLSQPDRRQRLPIYPLQ